MKTSIVGNKNWLLHFTFGILFLFAFLGCTKEQDAGNSFIVLFTPVENTFEKSVNVSLSTNPEGAEIWYTLTGTEPNKNDAASIKYISAIQIIETTTIKAKAFKDNLISKTYSATYTINNPLPLINLDYFPYSKGSLFEFSISETSGTTSSATTKTGIIAWDVLAFDNTTMQTTVSVSQTGAASDRFPIEIILKKTAKGIEYVTKNKFIFSDDNANLASISFFVANPVSKPSILNGSIKETLSSGSFTLGGVLFNTVVFKNDYMPSNDSYSYSNEGYEEFNKEIGFVHSYYYLRDGSSYPAFVFRREMVLKAYKIKKADGTFSQGGTSELFIQTPPKNPTSLTGVWKTNNSIELKWLDNSLNETSFELYKKTGTKNTSGVFVWDNPTSPDTVLQRNISTYVDSKVNLNNEYKYFVKAVNSFGSSNSTNEIYLSPYGYPNPPSDLVINYLHDPNYISKYWIEVFWKDNSDNETKFVLEYKISTASNWTVIELAANVETKKIIKGNYDIWPGGTYNFRIKAVSANGASSYVYADRNIAGIKSN